MEDWTRVVLYGTYDGFVRSTDESLQIAVMLGGGERVEIPSEYVMSTDQIVKKDKIKLKDVIKRIKYFDLVTQAVWINGILNELGSGFGLHKYHEGYKQGKLEGAMEREKVQVPQFVAEWIDYCKRHNFTLFGCLDPVDNFEVLVSEDFRGDARKCIIWCRRASDKVARAWLDGYTVEKEKRYLVKLKGIEGKNCYLKRVGNKWIISNFDEYKYMYIHTKHTRKELEDAGFGDVFNSPLFEIEEVE